MIILSLGMPRAGSGWYYNLTNDLMLAVGAQDARQIRQRYGLEKILTEVNCNIGALTLRRLLRVMVPSILGNTYVIKAHSAPTTAARMLMKLGSMRVAYIYRDPRDAMLSAMENGRRARGAGRENAFSELVDFETAVQFMKKYAHISEAWLAQKDALHTRYEDLLIEYDREAGRLSRFLRLDPSRSEVQPVIERYRPEKAQGDQKGLHFSHGKIGRFRSKLTPEQQATLAQVFGPYLNRLGYPV